MNLITIQTVNGEYARSMLAYDTQEQALSALYSTMASSIANPNLSKAVCELVDDDGRISKCERYSKPVVVTHDEEEQTEE